MSGYENIVPGKLRLKGKALDVKSVGTTQKKKKNPSDQLFKGNNPSTSHWDDDIKAASLEGNKQSNDIDDRLTPAERRYLQKLQQIEMQRIQKNANRSHRDRVLEFNKYLASLSEHYDIPKVGPG